MSTMQFYAPSPDDFERRAYDRLHLELSVEQDARRFLSTIVGVKRFLSSDTNPVYGDALVRQVLSRAHLVVLDLVKEGTTYSSMMIRDVSTKALQVEDKFRGILEAHNTEHQE